MFIVVPFRRTFRLRVGNQTGLLVVKVAVERFGGFVTGHAAFAYLCRDFSLKQESVEDVFANGEPSARRLVSLIDYCKANNVRIVFAESAASKEVSETLASEVGARIETIYTIESAEDGKSYLQRMDENLARIAESLGT